MYFRFVSALALILLIFIGGILLEKKNTQLRKEMNAQHEQMEAMQDYYAHLRIRTARMTLLPEAQHSTQLKNEESKMETELTEEKKSVVPLLDIKD
ncbi:hypothetical protein MNBD_PLANCTO02-850 [hydrothermal vent metagenome]|uniref:Uncharacterized protein n=1 Tax=hydrothermal vent metagenome TaxID=652676 RepID=A0A3B1D8Q0_9ZZZZ